MLLVLWANYVRACIRASSAAVILDDAQMRVNWMAWSQAEARQCVQQFVRWLAPVRKEFRASVGFLLDATFSATRRKHWPPAGATWDSIRNYTERCQRDESVFVPGVTKDDVEELYFAMAKAKMAEWFNRCPDKAFVDCGHTVGFTEGKAVSIMRIQIGDLRAIHGIPDDGRDRHGHPVTPIADLKFVDPRWAVSFQKRCAG